MRPTAPSSLPFLISRRSRVGLNAANFFVGQGVAVVLPFLNDLLRERGWRYDAIGVATAMAGLGVLLMQTPAGIIAHSFGRPRALLALSSVGLGVGYAILPAASSSPTATKTLLLLSGASQAFFTPLLAALALALVGHDHLSRMIGPNRVWNNVGHIVAAITAMIIVATLGTAFIFAAVFVVSILAAASCALIRPDELLRHRHSSTRHSATARQGPARDPVNWKALFTDKRVILLLVSTAFFQLSNAPVIPLVALYIKSLHGSDELIGALVLVAQTAMIPFVLLSGRLCDRWGRRPLFAIGFLVLPVRILLCSLTDKPHVLVAIQSLEGIGAGIECVVVASICADLTREHGGFNALIGLVATPIGGVLGPLLTGVLVQHFGFVASFRVFAVIATLGAAIFLCFMPETMPGRKADE